MTASATGALRPPHVDDPTRASEWCTQAACRGLDPETWFAVGTTGPALAVTATAKSICISHCPVRAECLTWALEHGEEGVWGGMDEEERRLLKRRASRRREAAEVSS